jgi:HAMP domain-containing protein
VSPYAAIAAALIAAGLISWSIQRGTGKPLAANKSSFNAVREQEMSNTPPLWDNLTAMEKAVNHMMEAASHLSYVRNECFDDDPYKGHLSHLINLLRDSASMLLPPIEGWPEPKEGMGVILPFIPRQTG